MAVSVSQGRRRGRAGGISEINVTPLVDVMLVLLIVFMVTAPLLAAGLPVNLPNAKAETTPIKDAKLVLTVTKDERIFFGEDDISDRLVDTLLGNERVKQEKEIYIRADKEVRYGAVASVVAAARSAGIEGLSLLIEQDESKHAASR